MATLKNHPQFSLRDDAAAAFDRYEDAHGIIRVSSARRTVAEQQELINRWNRGGTQNRPPYLYQPARPAEASNHVDNDGEAVDSPDYEKFNNHCEDFGFRQTFPNWDKVHFDFFGTVTLASGGTALAFSQIVKNEQVWLNSSRGEKLVVDGLKGKATRDAYRRYQTFLRGFGYAGLIDGVWGPATQEAHAKFYESRNKPAPAPVPVVKPTQSKTSNLADVQRKLKTNYPMYAGRLVVDGIDGPATRAAVKNFQRRSGLTPDGIAGPKTRRALGL